MSPSWGLFLLCSGRSFPLNAELKFSQFISVSKTKNGEWLRSRFNIWGTCGAAIGFFSRSRAVRCLNPGCVSVDKQYINYPNSVCTLHPLYFRERRISRHQCIPVISCTEWWIEECGYVKEQGNPFACAAQRMWTGLSCCAVLWNKFVWNSPHVPRVLIMDYLGWKQLLRRLSLGDPLGENKDARLKSNIKVL